MAVRIYALAKELKLDSKELVDICTKAGIQGKGSALASLTEEEAEKLMQFLKGSGPKSRTAAKAAPERKIMTGPPYPGVIAGADVQLCPPSLERKMPSPVDASQLSALVG